MFSDLRLVDSDERFSRQLSRAGQPQRHRTFETAEEEELFGWAKADEENDLFGLDARCVSGRLKPAETTFICCFK